MGQYGLLLLKPFILHYYGKILGHNGLVRRGGYSRLWIKKPLKTTLYHPGTGLDNYTLRYA
jgi:hypothetical protein